MEETVTKIYKKQETKQNIHKKDIDMIIHKVIVSHLNWRYFSMLFFEKAKQFFRTVYYSIQLLFAIWMSNWHNRVRYRSPYTDNGLIAEKIIISFEFQGSFHISPPN